jgi:hypothetical protein
MSNTETKPRCPHCGQVLPSAPESRAVKTARLRAGWADYMERKGLCTSRDAVRKRLLRSLLKAGEPMPPRAPHPLKGKKLSLEHRAKLSAAKQAKRKEREAARARGEPMPPRAPHASKGRKFSPEHRAKISATKAAKRKEREAARAALQATP